jgi:hypothetical protein
VVGNAEALAFGSRTGLSGSRPVRRTNGPANGVPSHVCAGVEEFANTTRQRVESLLAWRATTVARVREAHVSGVAERVAGDLIGDPIVRALTIARSHTITPQGAMLALRRLARLGIVTEQRVGGRVHFVAEEAFALLRA